MEKKERTYYNQVACTGAERGEIKGHKVLKLRFNAYDKEKKAQVNKFFTMFLTEENNDRNREALCYLGVPTPPSVVNYEAVGNLQGLGGRTVDLVAEINEAGYENIKYINEPKFGLRVFDMK